MTIFGIDVVVSGKVEYNIEDTAVGYVPYGDTHVWHPGGGMQAIDIKLIELTELVVTGNYVDGKCIVDAGEVNLITLLNQGKDKVWESIAQKVELDDAIESETESAKEEAALARAGL
jgi:hypothetical protein